MKKSDLFIKLFKNLAIEVGGYLLLGGFILYAWGNFSNNVSRFEIWGLILVLFVTIATIRSDSKKEKGEPQWWEVWK